MFRKTTDNKRYTPLPRVKKAILRATVCSAKTLSLIKMATFSVSKVREIMRLSSDYVYHFKAKQNRFLEILSTGFPFVKWDESLPYLDAKQQNFVTCFCDILWKDNSYHRSIYGNNAIVLTKDWAIKNEISPVRYIHEKSAESEKKWYIRKMLNNEIRQHVTSEADYALALIHAENEISKNIIDENNVSLLQTDQIFKMAFVGRMITFIKSNSGGKFNTEFGKCLNELYAVLEKRDSGSRNYKEDFVHPVSGPQKDKILYDEREWRKVKHPENQTEASKKVLDQSKNIKFNDNDVEFIVVEDEIFKNKVLSEIVNGATLLSKISITKVVTLSEVNTQIEKRIQTGEYI